MYVLNELVGFAPTNDGANAYRFLYWVTGLTLFNAMQQGEMNDNWPEMIPKMFQEMMFFILLSDFKHFLECLALLNKEYVVPHSIELVEKIVGKDTIYCLQGHAKCQEGLDATDYSECDFWIYTCQP